MATDPKDQEWYSVAEQVSTEMDPAKLSILVSRLCAALDRRTNTQALVAARPDATASSTAGTASRVSSSQL
jgi:hypothetical protein